jgi:hypothetical protein
MRRRPFRSLLAAAPLAAVLFATACSSEPFEEDACPAASCSGEGPSCRAYDFSGSTCPADFQLSGDTSNADVIGECQSGKLHVAAKDTLDITASLGLDAPDTDYTMRISTRIAVTDWDGGAVLKLQVGAVQPFVLRATMTPAGNVSYELCHGVTCEATYESAPGKEHRFDFDVSSTGTVATVDCKPFGTTTALVLPKSTGIQLSFGKTDGQPIDGTLDDVVVAFR